MATTGKGLPRSLKGAKISAAWADITGKPSTFTPTVGTTATTAMAGNKVPTATQRGGVLLQAAQADSAAAPTQAEFNALLAKLRAAGIITP
ncbi:MAG: hypothetical protein [Caudoviricetes sp.]|jgi:hypothetical protein|nr:MAG: hypothetical protein [Caudoviricetes sp.]